MPTVDELAALLFAERLQAMIGNHLKQARPVHIVHVEVRPHLPNDAFHGAAPIVVGDGVPVSLEAVPRAYSAESSVHAAMPIQHGSPHIESDGLYIH